MAHLLLERAFYRSFDCFWFGFSVIDPFEHDDSGAASSSSLDCLWGMRISKAALSGGFGAQELLGGVEPDEIAFLVHALANDADRLVDVPLHHFRHGVLQRFGFLDHAAKLGAVELERLGGQGHIALISVKRPRDPG